MGYTAEDKKAIDILSDITVFNKYAKYREDLKRRETWDELVDRNKQMHLKKYPTLKDDIEYAYENFVRTKKVLPSMRSLQFGGKAIEVNPVRIFNCSNIAIDDPYAFAEIMFLLLSGTGVGYVITKNIVDKLPTIKHTIKGKHKKRYLIADSIEGWAQAVEVLVNSYFNGKHEIEFDFSAIRPKGSRLLTSGGVAPGPLGLQEALIKITEVFESVLYKRGNNVKLKPIDVHDILCFEADAVLSGGIRRSAMIAGFDYDDEDMLTSKSGSWWEQNAQRARANNSAILVRGKNTIEDFNAIWERVKDSNAGEPGIYWSNVDDGSYFTNPCYAPGTLVHTKKGHFYIEDLVGKEVEIWDGSQWVVINNFRVTGENQRILDIELQDGTIISATPYHKFVLEDGKEIEAKDLKISDRLMIASAPEAHGENTTSGAYLKGFLIGDGTHGKDGAMLNLYEPKYMCQERLTASANEISIGEVNTNALVDVDFIDSNSKTKNGRVLTRKSMRGLTVRSGELSDYSSTYKTDFPKESFSWNLETKSEFIAGVMDSDGGAFDTKNGFMYQLTSVNKDWLLGFQNLLKTIGVFSKVVKYKDGGFTDFNDGYGEYPTKDGYRLTISQKSSIVLAKKVKFSRLTSFADKVVSYKLISKWNKIVDINFGGVEEKVYCCTVPTNHTFSLTCGVRTGQCAEISLKSDGGFCNLTEINAATITDQADFNERAKVGAFIGTLQAGYTNFHFLRQQWRDNAETEALLGVSMTGIASNTIFKLNIKEAASKMIEENKRVAAIIEINPAKRIGTVKPSGTTSLVLGTSSGIHAYHDDYYIRRMRIDKNEALYKHLSVFHPELVEDEYFAPHKTAVISVPQRAPIGAVTRNEDYQDLLDRVVKVKSDWIDYTHIDGPNTHNVSVTVNLENEEWDSMGNWMWNNQQKYNGISVLPFDGGSYKQTPFETITKEKYEELLKHLTEVDLTQVIEEDDMTSVVEELACSGGGCEIK